MDFPKISIVTPSLNSSKYLEATIQSVVSQNYPNLEYIIIDGGSNDGTVDIIKKYSRFITYWISEPDNGMYDAINKGFRKATGEIMAWLNSDDLYHPGSLMLAATIFRSLDYVNWIIGKSCLFNKDGLCVKMNDLQYWSLNRIFAGDYRWIQQENIFWRKNLWDQAGGHLSSRYKLAGDFELWMRFFKFSKLYSVQTSFAGFRLHGLQESVINSGKYEDEVKQILIENSNSVKNILPTKLFKAYRKIENKRDPINLIIKSAIKIVLKRLHRFPPSVFYDFSRSVWTTSF